MNELERRATDVGREHGREDAQFVAAYGGSLPVSQPVPDRFVCASRAYLTGWIEGGEAVRLVHAWPDDVLPAGSIGVINGVLGHVPSDALAKVTFDCSTRTSASDHRTDL